MMRQNFLLLVLGLAFSSVGVAQSYMPSQPLLNPGYHFAAMTGYHGAWQMDGQYRVQWPGIEANYVTQQAGTDVYVAPLKTGFGLQVINDRAGSGVLHEQEIRLTAAPRVKVNQSITLMSGIGFGIGRIQANFSSQYPAGWPNMPVQTTGAITTMRLAVSGGAVLFDRLLAVYQLTSGLGRNESFFANSEAKFPALHHTYLSYRIDLGDHAAITPAIRYARQGEFNNLTASMNAYLHGVVIGAGYRWGDAIIAQVGYQIADRVLISYSYDSTVSSLGTQTLGSHEFGIRTTLFKGKAKDVLIENLQLM